MKKKYNNMYAQTPVEEKRSSFLSDAKPADEHLYENSYIGPDKKEDVSDGVNVTLPQPEVSKNLHNDIPKVKETWYVAKINVNFRLTPDVTRTDNIIGTLKQGEKVKYLEDSTNGFVRVDFENKKGYIKKEYLNEV